MTLRALFAIVAAGVLVSDVAPAVLAARDSVGEDQARHAVPAAVLPVEAPARQVAERVAPLSPGYIAPRTPWGDPDLEGIWPSIDMVRVPLERPLQYGERVFMTDEEHAVLVKREDDRIATMVKTGQGGLLGAPGDWVEWGRSQRQTSLVVYPLNGRMPPVTPAGRARQERMPRGTAVSASLQGPRDFTMSERCISRGVLGSTLPTLSNSGMDITQAPGYVAIRYEMVHDTRVIPLAARPHLPAAIRQHMGDARGRWEDDTLVVETISFPDSIGFGAGGTGVPPGHAARLTERFTRVSPDVIRYEATVEDRETWEAPWTVAFPLFRDPGYIMAEYACHEGNLAMRFALSGTRADEAKGMGR